ncbi:glycosyltransferase [Secundilactobacillus collinoides]|uniref:glycosyltransferase n=1 Tax=Secundilactobacillus collinoides TaxID=33960 RepID=UPI0006D24F1E|nr:glycosyltransferase [Secundilactobacillus collinoides]
MMQKLTIIVPAYNHESTLHSTIQQLLRVEDDLLHHDTIGYRTRLLVVDDGSRDQTWQTIQDEHQFNHRVTGIRLSRHFGYDNALLAGCSRR